jgi:hypothetical protein
VRRDQARFLGFGGEVGVDAEDEVGVGLLAFQLQARQQGRAILQRHPVDLAAAVRLERLLQGRARAPLGHEGTVGIDGQGRRFGRQGWRGCAGRNHRRQ